MSNGIVLNHLSLPYSDINSAKTGFIEFLNVLTLCRTYGLKILLVDETQDKSLMRIELAQNYHVSDWLKNIRSDPALSDWGRRLRSLETKQPLFEKVDLNKINEELEVGLTDETKGTSTTLAVYWHDTFLASFSALESWLQPLIPVWVSDIRKGEYNEFNSEIKNLANEHCLKHHEALLCSKRDKLASTAIEIWNQRSDLFPNLTLLSTHIGTSLKMWSYREDILTKARDALYILESFSLKWKKLEYNDYQHDLLRELGLAAEVSGESKSVRENQKKKKERMFWLDDGRQVYCENHIKLPDGFRLHFYPDSTNRHIYVAYLGPHLTL